MTLIIIGLIICFIFLMCGIILFYKANQIKIYKNQQAEQYKQKLRNEVQTLQKDKNNLINLKNQEKQRLNEELLQFQESRKKELNTNLQKEKQIIKLNLQKINNQTSEEIKHIYQNLDNVKQSAAQQKQQIQNDIDVLKASLAAGVQARLREQQLINKLDFYKLTINDTDLADVKMLQNLKPSLHKPVVLSKLIWTQYFQKQMTELCDRVLGKNIVCGIYKITNLVTEQCYIGQSVNCGDRWKQHCKCGLGIEASSTNKLYNAMQKDGVWNFTFELLEQCPKELLNEKESFWIQMYQSNIYGYNIMKGTKI